MKLNKESKIISIILVILLLSNVSFANTTINLPNLFLQRSVQGEYGSRVFKNSKFPLIFSFVQNGQTLKQSDSYAIINNLNFEAENKIVYQNNKGEYIFNLRAPSNKGNYDLFIEFENVNGQNYKYIININVTEKTPIMEIAEIGTIISEIAAFVFLIEDNPPTYILGPTREFSYGRSLLAHIFAGLSFAVALYEYHTKTEKAFND